MGRRTADGQIKVQEKRGRVKWSPGTRQHLNRCDLVITGQPISSVYSLELEQQARHYGPVLWRITLLNSSLEIPWRADGPASLDSRKSQQRIVCVYVRGRGDGARNGNDLRERNANNPAATSRPQSHAQSDGIPRNLRLLSATNSIVTSQSRDATPSTFYWPPNTTSRTMTAFFFFLFFSC